MPFEETKKCQHVMASGRKCMSPAMKKRRFCVFHLRARQQNARILAKQGGEAQFQVGVLEDANSVQLALMQVMQMLATRTLDHKTAGTMLYALQTASINLHRPEFKAVDPQEEKDQEVLDALIALGKHLNEVPTPEGQKYADRLGRAEKQWWESTHPSAAKNEETAGPEEGPA
jgi:hypothetical protein